MSINQQLERQIRSMEFPEINVHERVMAGINTDRTSTSAERKPFYKVRSNRVMIAVALMLLFGTGFASATFINLYNGDGSLSLSIRGFDDNNVEPALTEEMAETYLNQILPGEAIAIYNPANNPQNIVSVLEKPLEIADWGELRHRAGQTFALPAAVPDSIIFEGGVVHHAAEIPDTRQLISQSEASGGEIVVEKVGVTDEIVGLTLNFLVEGETYTVSTNPGSRWSNVYTDFKKLQQTEVVPVMGVEGFIAYSEEKAVFMWRADQGRQDVFYRITTSSTAENVKDTFVSLLNLFASNQ